jgi:NHLM bacteriocin system ABC transporter peptidase/ATP-binding protein
MAVTAPAPAPTAPTHRRKPGRVPVVLQMEDAECGAASLGMVLGAFGRFVPLEKLRTECGVSRDGAKASSLVQVGRSYGMQTQGFRKSIQDLRALPLPCIVFWNGNHFLVVVGFDGDKVRLNDPAVGRRTVTTQEFGESYSGVVLTFEPTEQFQPGGQPSTFGRGLLQRLDGCHVGLVVAILAGVALAIPTTLASVFSQLFVDEVLIPDAPTSVWPLLAAMTFTLGLMLGLTYLQQLALLRLQTAITLKSSSRFLWHLLRLPSEFFSQRFVGGLVTRLQLSAEIAQLLSGQLATAFIGLITSVFYVVVMLFYSVPLTGIGIAIALVNLVVLQIVARRRIDANNLLQHEQLRLDGIAFGGLGIIETIKAQGAESDYFARWAGYQTHAVNAGQSVGRLTALLTVTPTTLSAFNSAAILVGGSVLVIRGSLTIGALIAFTGLMLAFLLPISNIVSLATQLQTARANVAQVQDVLDYDIDPHLAHIDSPARTATGDGGHGVRKLAGFVELRNLTFGYAPHQPPILQDFSLKMAPGARVALVGSTGSGKSTVGKLVLGLYEPWSGQVLLDGVERTQLARDVITNSVASVNQEIYLFAGTVAENLTLWDDTIDAATVTEAIDDAYIKEVVMHRAGGLESVMAEDGRDFSGGQRQRLEIARALALEPSVLVLDEATSALDTQTELEIDLRLRRRGCTCLIIAHRLSTIRDCDEIIVLDRGTVAERGTHEQLMAANGRYAELVAAG